MAAIGPGWQVAVHPGGSTSARPFQANFAQIRADELARMRAPLDDPDVASGTSTVLTAWGRLP